MRPVLKQDVLVAVLVPRMQERWLVTSRILSPQFPHDMYPVSEARYSDAVLSEPLNLFGFPYHTAPGEAEAECALFGNSVYRMLFSH